MEVTDIFSEYAMLQEQEDAIALKKEQLRPHILKMMLDSGVKQKDIGIGKFSLKINKDWSYPEPITLLEEDVKESIKALKDQVSEAKNKAQSTGEATCTESPTFSFTPVKL